MSVNHLDLSIELAAAAAGVSDRHLRRLCKAGNGPPQSPDGGFPAGDFGRWQREREREKYVPAGDGPRLDPTAERARLNQAQANKTELEVAQMAGELIRAEDVLEEWANKVAAARSIALNFPSRVAQRIAAPDQIATTQAAAQKMVHEMLRELAGDGLPVETRLRRERKKTPEKFLPTVEREQ